MADHVSSFEGKALAGVKEKKKNSNRGSENVNIEPEDGEEGSGIEAIFTDPKCLQVQSWLSLQAMPDVPTHMLRSRTNTRFSETKKSSFSCYSIIHHPYVKSH